MIGVVGSLVRVTLAATVLWLCWQDWPSIQARAGFEALPAYDVAAEANEFFKENRYSEALLLLDEALAEDPDNARLLAIRQGIETERTRWMRLLAAGGHGALTGEGTDTPSIAGALIADLFVFGDVRDLVVQSGRWLKNEETDEVIIALSLGGILLTASPSVDLGAAVLKLARRMGAMSKNFAKALGDAASRAVKSGTAGPVTEITGDVARLSKRASPSGTIAMLRHIDDVPTLKAAAKFSERPAGLRALLLDPDTSLRWLKSGWEPAQTWLLKAAAKGRKGLRYLGEHSTLMFRAHPLLGLVKGLYKGNVPEFLAALMREWSLPILGLVAAWAVFELALLLSRMAGWLAAPRRASVR